MQPLSHGLIGYDASIDRMTGGSNRCEPSLAAIDLQYLPRQPDLLPKRQQLDRQSSSTRNASPGSGMTLAMMTSGWWSPWRSPASARANSASLPRSQWGRRPM